MLYKTLNINKEKTYFIKYNNSILSVKLDNIYENNDDLDYYILYYVTDIKHNKNLTVLILYETKEEIENFK